MNKVDREDVVHAALLVEQWCKEHCSGECDCPFYRTFPHCFLDTSVGLPYSWKLKEKLRARGAKNGKTGGEAE